MKSQLQIIRASAPAVPCAQGGAGEDRTHQCWKGTACILVTGWMEIKCWSAGSNCYPPSSFFQPFPVCVSFLLCHLHQNSQESCRVMTSVLDRYVCMSTSRFMLMLTPKAGSGSGFPPEHRTIVLKPSVGPERKGF